MSRIWCLFGMLLFASACVSAAANVALPRVILTVGEESAPPWARCLVTPSNVALNFFPDNEQRSFSKVIALDAKTLDEQIRDSAKSELSNGLHIVETVPHIRIEAETKGIKRFTLLYDASGYDRKQGKDTDALIETAFRLCGKIGLTAQPATK